MPDLGVWYLLLRAPIQLVLIAWTYGFAVRRQKKRAEAESDTL